MLIFCKFALHIIHRFYLKTYTSVFLRSLLKLDVGRIKTLKLYRAFLNKNLIRERTYVLNISAIKKDVLVSRKDLIIFQIGF